MKPEEQELIPTRASLIRRLKDWRDETSWEEFFNTYWRLIFGISRKAGLTASEAEEVVQETMISVAKHMPSFEYDPAIGSFKSWLLNMTRWRIIAQFRKRRPAAEGPSHEGETSTRTSFIQTVADPNALNWEEIWEIEWRQNLFNTALENVKRNVDPMRFQVFDFYVRKEWPPEKVAARFGISVDQVYQIKHRLSETVESEVERLQKKRN